MRQAFAPGRSTPVHQPHSRPAIPLQARPRRSLSIPVPRPRLILERFCVSSASGKTNVGSASGGAGTPPSRGRALWGSTPGRVPFYLCGRHRWPKRLESSSVGRTYERRGRCGSSLQSRRSRGFHRRRSKACRSFRSSSASGTTTSLRPTTSRRATSCGCATRTASAKRTCSRRGSKLPRARRGRAPNVVLRGASISPSRPAPAG
jgi:hypothetical protein